MTPNETQILKDAIAYLEGASGMTDILIAPESQDFPAQFPCVMVMTRTTPVQDGLKETLLCDLTVQLSIYAGSVYDTAYGPGVLGILDKINALMDAKGYRRNNNTKPYYVTAQGKWCKAAWYSKKTNSF